MIHMTSTMKIIYGFAYASMIFAAALTFTTVYWLSKPYNILEFYNLDTSGRIVLQQREYCAGDTVNVFVDSDKKLPYVSTLYSSLINSITIPYTPQPSNASLGKHTIVFTREVPSYVPEGEYYFQFHPVYKVNPIRSIEYKISTQTFIVKQCNQKGDFDVRTTNKP